MKRIPGAALLSLLMAGHAVFAAPLAADSEAAATVGGPESPVPAFISQSDDEEKLDDCVVRGLKDRKIDDDRAMTVLLNDGKVDGLYRAVLADWPREALDAMALDPAKQLDDRSKLDAIAKQLHARPDEMFDMFRVSRVKARIRIAQAEALGIDCPTPPHLMPGGDPARDWLNNNQALILEHFEFHTCVEERFAEKLPEEQEGSGSWPLHDAIPPDVRDGIRRQVRDRLATEESLKAEDIEEIASLEKIEMVLLFYSLRTSMSFDMRRMIRSGAFGDYYKNRYLKLGCTPEPTAALLELAGIKPE